MFTGVVWDTISAAVLMFWDTDMADVLSRENAGSTGDTNLAPRVLLKRGKQRILGTRMRKTGHNVSSCILRHLQVNLQVGLKNLACFSFINQLFSVWISDKTLRLVLDELLELRLTLEYFLLVVNTTSS